jgi:cysteine-rich repeat protein
LGAAFSCALDATGASRCWGDLARGDNAAQGSGYESIVARGTRVCGLRGDNGEADCWRVSRAEVDTQSICDPDESNGVPPQDDACTTSELKALCISDAQADPPGLNAIWGYFGGNDCVLRSELDLEPEDDENGNPVAMVEKILAGSFEMLVMGGAHSCGLRADGGADCWGEWGPRDRSHAGCDPELPVPYCPERTDEINGSASNAGPFLAIAAGQNFNCGILDADRSIFCWGDNQILYPSGPSSPQSLPMGRFTKIAAGQSHACALAESGQIHCWGADINGLSTPPSGTFVELTAGDFHSCAIKQSGEIECWGSDRYGESSAPQGSFVQVVAGFSHTCATNANGTVSCWGGGTQSLPAFAVPLSGSYRAVGLRSGDGCSATCQNESGWDCNSDRCLTSCGDGIAAGVETCDDAATPAALLDGDGCSASCRVETGWSCDIMAQPSTCSDVCGNGVLDPYEVCDPNEFQDLAAACATEIGDDNSNDCASLIADYELQSGCSSAAADQCELLAGYTCRDENFKGTSETFRTCSRCGDGWVGGAEECDDGNAVSGDGCFECRAEGLPGSDDIYTCSTEPVRSHLLSDPGDAPLWWPRSGICTKEDDCGNRRVGGGEECDDGNSNSGDGCSDTCLIEANFICMESSDPNLANTPYFNASQCDTCGNGILSESIGEECDDGNLDNGDCCSSTCRFEAAASTCGDPSDSQCTDPDTCDGAGQCQANNAVFGASCGAAGDECTFSDRCDGAGLCETMGFKQSGTACSDDGLTCTTDLCDGSGVCAHAAGNPGTVCRASTGECDLEEACDGSSAACGPDTALTPGTPCGDGDEACSAQDTCDANGTCQPNHSSQGTACGDSPIECSQQDSCNGSGECLPNHQAVGTPCSDEGNPCTEDLCDGGGLCAHSPGNAGQLCRSAAGVDLACDLEEHCDGISADCPVDEYLADGTICDNADESTTADSCRLGICGCASGDDLDDDGVPNVCDLDDGGVLLSSAVVKYAGKKPGVIKLKGLLPTGLEGEDEIPDFDDGLTIVIRQGDAHLKTVDFAAEECRGNGKGVFRCNKVESKYDRPSLKIRPKVLRNPVSLNWEFKLKAGGISTPGPIGSDPSLLEISFSMEDVDRVGSLSNCDVRAKRLRCSGPRP